MVTDIVIQGSNAPAAAGAYRPETLIVAITIATQAYDALVTLVTGIVSHLVR